MVGAEQPRKDWGGVAQDETARPPSIQLAADRLMLKISKHEKDRMTKGGLALPDTVDKRDNASRAEVVDFGPGFFTHQGEFIPTERLVPGLYRGCRVAFQRNGAQEQPLQLGGEDYMVVRSGEIVGVIRGE